MNGGNLNGYGAGIEKGFRADDGAFARVDHVIDHDAFFAFDFADDVHGFGLEVIGTTLVDNREGRIEDFGEFPGAIDPAVVRGNDDDIPVIIATLLDGFGKERNGGQIIRQAREESLDLGSVKVGDTVSISSWMTGAACEGTIVSIDDYPTTSGNSWGDGNRNVSYYPFKVFVEEDAGLQANDYVDIQYQKAGTQEQGSSLYLQSWFIRTDNGKSYVMARNEDGRLEQRWVQTGRDLWGSYTQIRGGLTTDDYLAFPYGRDVVEGARTVEAAADELYNDGL